MYIIIIFIIITSRFLLKLFEIENFYEKVTCLQHHSHFQENFQPLKQQIHTLDSVYKVRFKINSTVYLIIFHSCFVDHMINYVKYLLWY